LLKRFIHPALICRLKYKLPVKSAGKVLHL